MTAPHPLRALPTLSHAQVNALRLADRDGGLRWSVTRACWFWGNAGVGVQIIHDATFNALERHGYLTLTRSFTLYPSDLGRAWLAANPDPCA